MFEELEARKQRMDQFRPFDAATLNRLDAVFEPAFIYGSNAIEGNTLSLGDTIYIVREGKLPGGKSETEYLEVKGQQDAYKYLRQATAGKFRLSEKLIREFHHLLTQRLDPEKYGPGQYKNRENQVRLANGEVFPYVSMLETPAAVQDLVTWYAGEGQHLHPVERAAQLHYRFILIHPFNDGNGRTARLLTNFALLESGHSMAIFRADEHRRVYLDALRAVDNSVALGELGPKHPALNFFPLVSHLERELLWSYDQLLDVLEGRAGLTTDELIRRFGGIEGRGPGRSVTLDEEERMKALARAVEQLTSRIDRHLRPLKKGLNTTWTDLDATVDTEYKLAKDLLGAKATNALAHPSRKDLLANKDRAMSSVKGRAALMIFTISKRASSDKDWRVPTNGCEFIVFAEPHAIKLGTIVSIGQGDEPPTTSVTSFETEPTLWRESEIDTLVLSEANRFLREFELELRAANAGGAPT